MNLDKTQDDANGERKDKKKNGTDTESITIWDPGGAKTNQLVTGKKGRTLYLMAFIL